MKANRIVTNEKALAKLEAKLAAKAEAKRRDNVRKAKRQDWIEA